jgi:selenocysteine-specific elongation factor
MPDSVVFGTAGHIDHGKSALVRALTGVDPDRLKEEQIRGITIDLGFAHFVWAGLTFALVDVPGHERFVKNMLAGATGIDFVLLVVAADESVMPQTREHFDICRLLGVAGGVIALTKIDLVDADTLELARLEVRELVAGSFLEDAPIVPVSARTGEGLDALREAMAHLARARPRAWRPAGPGTVARLPIDRAFTVRGFGTVVTGTLVSGSIRPDDELVVVPGGRAVKVRGVQVHGESQAVAVAGSRTAVNLAGVEVAEVQRGHVLVTPNTLQATDRLDAVLELLPSARPLRHGTRVRVHLGTAEVLGRVALAGSAAPGDAPAAPLERLEPGGRAYVRLRLEGPLVATRGDRYVVRAYSPPVTIGGGLVLDPEPPRSALRTAAALRRFERLDPARTGAGAADEAVTAMVEERGAAGLDVAALVRRGGLAPGAVATAIDRLARAGRLLRAGEVLVSPRVVAHLGERVLAELAAHHEAQPLADGLPREELRARVFRRANPAVFARVLDDLAAEGRVVVRERVALAGHQPALSNEEARAREVLERLVREGGLTPPDTTVLREAAGVPPEVADRVLAWLVRQRVLVRLDTILFHHETLARLKAEIAALKAGSTGPVHLDVGTFKTRYGVSRKYAIPLLEFLDRERVTRRVGDRRLVL